MWKQYTQFFCVCVYVCVCVCVCVCVWNMLEVGMRGQGGGGL